MWKCKEFRRASKILDFKTLFKTAVNIIGLVSVSQFSHSVTSYSLRPHELQHTRPPYASPTSGVHSNSRPLSWWHHPAISSSVVPFSSCLQSFPASGSFQMSQLFTSGGQSIGVSASALVLPMNTQDWSPLGWTGWSLAVYNSWGHKELDTTEWLNNNIYYYNYNNKIKYKRQKTIS